MKIIIETHPFLITEDVQQGEQYDFGLEISRNSSDDGDVEDDIKLEIPGVGVTYIPFKEARVLAAALVGFSAPVAPVGIEFVQP